MSWLATSYTVRFSAISDIVIFPTCSSVTVAIVVYIAAPTGLGPLSAEHYCSLEMMRSLTSVTILLNFMSMRIYIVLHRKTISPYSSDKNGGLLDESYLSTPKFLTFVVKWASLTQFGNPTLSYDTRLCGTASASVDGTTASGNVRLVFYKPLRNKVIWLQDHLGHFQLTYDV